MKGFKLVEKNVLKETEIPEQKINDPVKVKITKALVTLSDVLRYNGEIDCENVVLGSYGIGVVSESLNNLFGIEKGNHVYIEPSRPCEECYNCKNLEEMKCSDLKIAGEDYDGFLSDFVCCEANKIFLLPDSVSDFEALFIDQISLGLSIIDKLNIQKGDYVAVLGANDFGIIMAQLLIYYQAVPILITDFDDNIKTARDSGIYYVLGKDSNWQKEVALITGGRMAKSVVYISDSDIPANKMFSLASFNAKIAFTGSSYKSSSVSFSQAVKKQLDIHCINTGTGNTAASINILANKAIDLSHLKINTSTYDNVPKLFETLNKTLEKDGEIYETVVDMI